jgi:hypothetical protein
MARHYQRTPPELAARVPKYAVDSSIGQTRNGLAGDATEEDLTTRSVPKQSVSGEASGTR